MFFSKFFLIPHRLVLNIFDGLYILVIFLNFYIYNLSNSVYSFVIIMFIGRN